MKPSASEIQDNICSNYDAAKQCSFDVEFIDCPTKPLIHQMARFLYFFRGSGVIKVNGTAYEIRPNSIVAILPWDTSEITEVSESLQFYKIIYSADLVSRAMHAWYNPKSAPLAFLGPIEENPIAYLSQTDAQDFLTIMLTLRNEIGVESSYDPPQERDLSDILIVNKLVELSIRYLRAVTGPRDTPCVESTSPVPDNCKQIFKYLYSHLSEHLTLSKLSAALYMSESSISKYIASATALSFNDVLNEMRLSKATDILTHTNMTLSEVAELCGFSDAPHLSKAFTSQAGITANEYRKIMDRKVEIFSEREKRTGFEIIAYIYENFSDPGLNIKSAMTHFNLSAKEINKFLLLYVEKNFDDFLNYIRINRACGYLLTTKMGILDIAIEVGYNNVKTFNRNFIKLKNITPGNFKKTTNLQIAGESIAK